MDNLGALNSTRSGDQGAIVRRSDHVCELLCNQLGMSNSSDSSDSAIIAILLLVLLLYRAEMPNCDTVHVQK